MNLLVEVAPPPSPVAIVGSRDYKDLEAVRRFVRSLPENACVVSGGARGVDQAAEAEAFAEGFALVSFRPERWAEGYKIIRYTYHPHKASPSFLPLSGEYKTFPQAAHARNSMIVAKAVAESGSLTAYWTGQIEHSGTFSVIQKATKAGILYQVFTDQEDSNVVEMS